MGLREAGAPHRAAGCHRLHRLSDGSFRGYRLRARVVEGAPPLKRNQYGVFFIVWPVPPLMKDPLRYRLMVDGAWFADPLNPNGSWTSPRACPSP
jgi:hypothetical protein